VSARFLHLTLTTPEEALVDGQAIRSLRAEDGSGSFGILPGHADLLTALPASVIRWTDTAGVRRFCVVRAGVLLVRDGTRIDIACRQAIASDELDVLQTEIARFRNRQAEADRTARVEQTRLHAQAVRQLMRYLRSERAGPGSPPPPAGGVGS